MHHSKFLTIIFCACSTHSSCVGWVSWNIQAKNIPSCLSPHPREHLPVSLLLVKHLPHILLFGVSSAPPGVGHPLVEPRVSLLLGSCSVTPTETKLAQLLLGACREEAACDAGSLCGEKQGKVY